MKRARQQKRNGRRGFVFSVRVTDDQRACLEQIQARGGGPRSIGAFMLWRALQENGSLSDPRDPPEIQLDLGIDLSRVRSPSPPTDPTLDRRIVLDLCAGSGSWSAPYEAAGYDVRRVTLPEHDVRTYVPKLREGETVHGVLAAPPCDQFSVARNGHPKLPRDLGRGMECVNACLRIVLQARPTWWALENPAGLLSRFLGTPADLFEPCDFGDPWTKRTALWGQFTPPTRGPFVQPLGGGPFCPICDPAGAARTWCSNAAHRAVTPAGFARAFFRANP